MTGKEAHERLLEALRREIRRHWGSIGEKEAAIQRSGGYLSKIVRGSWSIPLDLLMRFFDEFGIDPRAFFGEAFDIVAVPELFLAEIEGQGPIDAVVARMIRGLSLGSDGSDVVAAPNVGGPPAPELVARLASRTRAEQRRSLRKTQLYRRADFVGHYLEHLDEIRYRRPADAVQLAEALVLDLLPHLGGNASRRCELACRALGICASALRVESDLPSAARAIRAALEVARREEWPEAVAELLQRGAYVLSDQGLYRRALSLLREALEIYVEHELSVGVGKTLVDRGIMFHYAGQHERAIRCLGRAWKCFSDDGTSTSRNRQAVVHHLALAYTSLGDLEAAEAWVRKGFESFSDDDGPSWARLVWQQGRIALARGELRDAERRLRHAVAVFDRSGDPESVHISLDLLKTLLALGETWEAQRVARGMVAKLMAYRGTRLSDAIFDEFVRAGHDGAVTLSLIDRILGRLQKRRL